MCWVMQSFLSLSLSIKLILSLLVIQVSYGSVQVFYSYNILYKIVPLRGWRCKYKKIQGKKAPGSSRCRITSRPPPITTPVASDQVWVSDNNKKTIAETNAVASKNAWTNKIKEKMHALSPKVKHEGGNEAIHAPSADKVFVSWCLAVFWGWQIICVNIKNTWCLGIRSYHYRTIL